MTVSLRVPPEVKRKIIGLARAQDTTSHYPVNPKSGGMAPVN